MDFNENLGVKYNGLTKQGAKVADFIRNNPEAAVKMTAKEIGSGSGTSPAAVIRLCRQLGYESLENMKIHLAKSLTKDDFTLPIDTIIGSGDSLSELCQKLYGNVHNALHGTLELLDYNELRQAVNILHRASRIFIFAVGGSGLAASDLCHKLNRINRHGIFLADGHTSLEFASLTTKKDVVICFSYSGETREVFLAAKAALANGTPVIGITRSCASTLSALSTVVLSIPEVEKRVRVGSIGSKFAQLFIADALYLALFQKNFGENEAFLLKTSKTVNQLRE